MQVSQSCLTLQRHGLYSPWNTPGQNTEWIGFPFSRGSAAQELNRGFPHCRWILYQMSYQGSPCGAQGCVKDGTSCAMWIASPGKNCLLQDISELHGLWISETGITHVSCMCSVTSVVSDSATPWTVAYQGPLSMGFSRQEYWSGFPCPPPGDLPDPRVEPVSLTSPVLAGRFFTASPPGKPDNSCSVSQICVTTVLLLPLVL